MNPWIVFSAVYSGGALITCLWVAAACRKNPELRHRHEVVAVRFTWPLLGFVTAVAWPAIVFRLAVYGEPHDEES